MENTADMQKQAVFFGFKVRKKMDAKTHKRCEFEIPSWFSLAKEHYVDCFCSPGEAANRSSPLPALESSGAPWHRNSDALGGVGIKGLSHRHRNQLKYVVFIRNMHTRKRLFISP